MKHTALYEKLICLFVSVGIQYLGQNSVDPQFLNFDPQVFALFFNVTKLNFQMNNDKNYFLKV